MKAVAKTNATAFYFNVDLLTKVLKPQQFDVYKKMPKGKSL